MKILIDAMGGDNGTEVAVQGAVDALKSIQSKVMLVGDKEKILSVINEKYTKNSKKILEKVEILHAPDVITNDDEPAFAIKNKKESSIVKAYEYMKEHEDTVFVSAGSTGAVMAGGLLKLKRIEGIHRPALTTVLPTADGKGTILLDCGANVESSERSVMQHAEIGKMYAKEIMKKDNVTVALLNIGAEDAKGSLELKEINKALRENCEGFIGNIEAREILTGVADVVVATGIMGNTALKAIEGTAKIMKNALKSEFTVNIFSKIRALFAKGIIEKALLKYDYTRYGGAVLLGIKKPVIKIHGNAKPFNFEKAIIQADEIIKSNLVKVISSKIEEEKIKLVEEK